MFIHALTLFEDKNRGNGCFLEYKLKQTLPV